MGLRLLLRSLAVLALAGCATRYAPPDATVDIAAAARPKIVYTIAGKPEWAARLDWVTFVDRFQAAMAGAAAAAGHGAAYRDAAAPREPGAAAVVRVTVADYSVDRLTAAERWPVGIYDGHAALEADVDVVDPASGSTLASRHLSRAGNPLASVFVPMTERQLDEVAAEIVRLALQPAPR